MSITFIIPTIGRQSLQNSINSLLKQTIKDWHAIIIFDGIKCNLNNNDERIQIIEIEKTGININSAGNVRNYGMSLATTEWIAFLDDDDTIAIDYIETFNYELIKKMKKNSIIINTARGGIINEISKQHKLIKTPILIYFPKS